MKNTTLQKKLDFHKKYIKTKKFDEVRKAVFERDHHRCVLCGRTDDLVCHHTSYKHLGYGDQKEIDDCITLCKKDHLNHHSGKYNIWWYSIEHPRNNDDLRELDIDGHKILVRSNGEDIYDGTTYRRLKIIHHKDRDRYGVFIDGKTNYVSRLVAMAFPEICGEWFDGCEVHHIDMDKSNNSADNLKVLTKEEHKREHIGESIERLKLSHSKKIYQYSLSGNYIAGWNSIIEAAERLGLNKSAISNCIQGVSITSGNYIWKTFDEGEDIPLWIEPIKSGTERSSEKQSIEISQYDKDGNWIRDWKGLKEATKEMGGKSNSSINNCLKGRSKSAFGYIWKYKKDEEDN